MTHATAPPTSHPEPLVRSRLYKLLSLGFRYPDAEGFETLQSGEYLNAVWECVTAVPHLERLATEKPQIEQTIRNSLNGVSLLDLEVGFNQTFEVGAPEPPCPPYEGVYRQEETRTSLMVEIAEFYKHFGLHVSQEEGKRDLPDHLCAELEFLHFLTFKEAQARHEENTELLDGYLLAQKDFLERHLAKWLPTYSEKMRSSSTVPFYTQLARIAAGYVANELEWVQTTCPPPS
ncbi:molecular chaperone TorD family protein [Geobacter pickeringii]|uniref:molecular chaperone TorD family protein n=1 Tax=Geobacter pickeringii TaxID=345632 RepID=UPI0006907D66|nr:molecular chaperone TorD family protein [Geobacter pickeringii]